VVPVGSFGLIQYPEAFADKKVLGPVADGSAVNAGNLFLPQEEKIVFQQLLPNMQPSEITGDINVQGPRVLPAVIWAAEFTAEKAAQAGAEKQPILPFAECAPEEGLGQEAGQDLKGEYFLLTADV